MSPSPSSSFVQSQIVDRLSAHGSEGLRAELAGVIDLDALEQQRYGEVLESVDARLTTAQYSLVSMRIAGIYFGLLVGWWLLSLASWGLIARWLIPVLLVTVYAANASYQTIQEMRQLSEARALLTTLTEDPSPNG